jgi:hypothetical protein
VFYIDRGFSSGMVWGLKDAVMKMQTIEFRSIGWRCRKPTYDEVVNIRAHAVKVMMEAHKEEIEARQKTDPDFCEYLLVLQS